MDKNKWEIKKDVNENISLYKGGHYSFILLKKYGENCSYNLTTVSRDIAHAINGLMETKDVLNENTIGYCISYNTESNWWDIEGFYCTTNRKHFKTEETVRLAAKALNESKDLKDWITQRKGGK